MTYASVVSGAALALVAVAAASEVSAEDTAAKGNPWTLVGGSNRGKLSNTDDTVVSGIKPVVVVNYYQSLHKDDTPGEEESMFSSISDNEVKNIEENLDEGEYKYVTSNKKKKKKKKKKKEPKEKESTVPRKYEYSVEGKQEKDKSVPPAGIFDDDDVTDCHPGNIIATEDVVGKEAAQDAPGKNAPFLSSLTAYDHLVSSYPYPSSEFLPDNPDSTQKNHHDHYQHYHGHDYKTDTDTKIATDASSFYDRLHVGYNEGHHQKHPYLHQKPNVSTQVRESSQGLEEAITAVVTPPLHNNGHYSNMDSRAATTIGRGSGDGVTGDVEVDVGMLQTRRSLNSVGNDCNSCASRPKIEVSGSAFKSLVSSCYPDASTCQEVLPIGCWDTSAVTDMSLAFSKQESFNGSINCWNTALVTSTRKMFYQAYDFNQPLNVWNVESVTDMTFMFDEATTFNQPLNDWNVASVNNMAFMFYKAIEFNQPLDDWNVASVTDMNGMFRNAFNFNQPLDDWDVARVNNMGFMFQFASKFNEPLDDWNVASVTDMGYMFIGLSNFNQPLNDWNVANVSSMRNMFYKATSFNQPLDDWNVASVYDIVQMFYQATKFNQCLSRWADKIPPDAGSVFKLFKDSGCPNQDPVLTVGPWCQGEDEQCLAPSNAPSAQPTSASSALPTSASSALPTSASSALPTSASSASPTEATIASIAPTVASNVSPKKKSKKSKK